MSDCNVVRNVGYIVRGNKIVIKYLKFYYMHSYTETQSSQLWRNDFLSNVVMNFPLSKLHENRNNQNIIVVNFYFISKLDKICENRRY